MKLDLTIQGSEIYGKHVEGVITADAHPLKKFVGCKVSVYILGYHFDIKEVIGYPCNILTAKGVLLAVTDAVYVINIGKNERTEIRTYPVAMTSLDIERGPE